MDQLDPDSSSRLLLFVGLCGSLLLFAAAAAAEAIIRSAKQYEIRPLIEQRVPGSVSLKRLLDFPDRRRSLLMVVRLLGVVSAAAHVVLLTGLRTLNLVMALGALVLILIVLDQATFALFRGRIPPRGAASVAILVEGLGVLLTPLLWGLEAITRALGVRAAPEPSSSLALTEEEVRILAGVIGEEDAELSPREREMISRIFELHGTTVREIMVPRLDIVALPAETPLLKALDIIVEHGYSRIPVYEGTIDNIVGVLYAKDLLEALRDGKLDTPVRELARGALFVPESKKLDELLKELQQSRIHMAIVVDEYGGTAGVATIEDILEEIVGEIRDEYDVAEEALIIQVSPEEAVCNGRVDLDDLNRLLDLDLPTDRSDTLGGLIYSELGRVPQVGDEVTVDGAHFRVVGVSGRRITKVRVKRIAPPEDAQEEASQEAEQPQKSEGRLGFSRLR